MRVANPKVMIDNFLLIVGAMKCGTTSLFHYLSQHPQICRSNPKEPNFFANDENWGKGLDFYQKLWNFDPNIHSIAMEASTHYTKMPVFPNASERISKLENKAKFKFIYIMRNPIKQIESHYTHGLVNNWKSTRKPLSEGISDQVLAFSNYTKQIREYYQRFSADDILLLNFDDLKADPAKILKEICSFVSINDSFQFDTTKISNVSKDKYVDSAIWNKIEPVAQYLPRRFRKYVRSSLGTKIEEKVKLSSDQQKYVLNELRDDLIELRHKYCFDFTSWGIDI